MSIEDLEQQVIQWAHDRGVFAESTHLTGVVVMQCMVCGGSFVIDGENSEPRPDVTGG